MKWFLISGLCALLAVTLAVVPGTAAQNGSSRIFVNVVLVQLNVAVTDKKGNYVTGLKPENFLVTEDRIPEKISSFEEGGAPGGILEAGTAPAPENGGGSAPVETNTAGQQQTAPRQAEASALQLGLPKASHLAGASVFVLFDTSDYMYRGFVFAQDAIGGFVRTMEEANKIAFYSYSRNLSRATLLTTDRSVVMRGVRNTVAGDEAALYNALLLTVRDAAQLHGRKAIVVFSNGPDNASTVPPEDVEELAQSTGTIIYIISTRQARDEPISSAVFERMSRGTGGKAYFAKDWRDESMAFASIKEDLAHLYTISYYPKLNQNRGWRTISVRLVGPGMEKYRVRTRDGYRLQEQVPQPSAQAAAEPPATPTNSN
ncbi:MAG TPA: VWA domain-containing protein [Acidobacteriaceae bacterium]|nr:VWA domain-containing protein [Acidobacteriaceae bacterium]